MINLSDLSIIIPFRLDTEDRTENLKTVLRYFETFFEGYEHYEKCGVIKNTISMLYEQSVKQISSNKLSI